MSYRILGEITIDLCWYCGARRGYCLDMLRIKYPINPVCPDLEWIDGQAKPKRQQPTGGSEQ